MFLWHFLQAKIKILACLFKKNVVFFLKKMSSEIQDDVDKRWGLTFKIIVIN
jgi:hypothetical protein